MHWLCLSSAPPSNDGHLSSAHARTATPVALLMVLVPLLCSLPAAAQTDDLASMTVDQLWEKADTMYKAGDAAGARPIYQYIVDHHGANAERAAWALYRLCSISYNERDIDTALALIQRVPEQYPESAIHTRGYAAFYLTAIYLVFKKDYQAGIDVAEEHLQEFAPQMGWFQLTSVVERLARCHMGLGDNQNALAALKRYAIEFPDLLRQPAWYNAAFDVHVVMRDTAGALSTARAAYALCDFEDKAIQDAAEIVRRAFITNGELHKGIQFLAAQEDAGKPNPLTEVPMPQLTPEEQEQLLQAAGEDKPKRLLVLVYMGQADAAIATALGYMCEAGGDEAVSSLKEVARALKAADCNVVRANQFINYAKTGEGENPVADVVPE